MLNMLQRLIGEDIALIWRPAAEVSAVRIDPSQIDQILTNLAVNARDAIAGVGQIIIETANVVLDQAFCDDHPGCVPGSYAMLSFTDSGCGMDAETLEHVFEPFFTTKGENLGTGLGLATVYGIVKQNRGFISAYSEPGQGAVFRIYLPQADKPVPESPAAVKPAVSVEGGNETILLVEDEKSIRITSKLFLEAFGYHVLAAEDPAAAERLSDEFQARIHLLVTDVVMPGMSGSDLARKLAGKRPDMKCLFISGYTPSVIARRGILKAGVNFLSKPFGREQLAGEVRKVLDQT